MAEVCSFHVCLPAEVRVGPRVERTIHDLNAVVLSQQNQIDAFERRFKSLASEMNGLIDKTRETRTLEDDKPPHY